MVATSAEGTRLDEAIDAIRRRGGIGRTGDLARDGVRPSALTTLWRQGRLIRLKAGLYQLAESLPDEHASLIQAALAVPNGVICLTSALDYYDLTDANPEVVFLAMPLGSWTPRVSEPPLQIVHFRPRLFQGGIEIADVDGHQIRIYSREKTLCDCLRMPETVGLDVTLIALRRYLRSPLSDVGKLLEMARCCRVYDRMRTYIEAMIA